MVTMGILLGTFKLLYLARILETSTGLTPLSLGKIAFNGGVPVKQSEGKINVLLMGVSGGDHEGSDLTDTIMVASLNPVKRTISLISIPRDIWSENLKDKINSAYHYGKIDGDGLSLSKTTIEEVVGIPIHYTFLFDFSGFQAIIDHIGGINVAVETSFTDSEYPIAGKENDLCDGDYTYACRYETITFNKGMEYMDGARALKYVRSRHAEGDAGTDFARGTRQQEVIIAIKNKILAKKPWFHPTFSMQLYAAVDTYSETDMKVAEILTIGKLFVGKRPVSIKRISIEPLLMMPPEGEYDRYVLVPVESFKTIQEYIKSEIEK